MQNLQKNTRTLVRFRERPFRITSVQYLLEPPPASFTLCLFDPLFFPTGDCVLVWPPQWSACTRSCDGGTQQRRMRIARKAQPGGKACPLVPPKQTRACNVVSCALRQPIAVVLCETTRGHIRMVVHRTGMHVRSLARTHGLARQHTSSLLGRVFDAKSCV